mgnify:CR=1 FL=1
MKIAMYVGSWPPGAAATGIVTYAGQLVPALRRLGNEVFVIAGQVNEAHADPHVIDLRRFLPAPTLLGRAISKLASARSAFHAVSSAIASATEYLVARHGVQVFEMEESFGWTALTSRRGHVPVVVRLHGPWFMTGKYNDPGDNDPFHRNRVELEGRAIVAADLVSANCMDTLRLVRQHYGAELPGARIVPTPLDAAADRDAWDVHSCDRDTILFVGRFDRLKGGDLVLRVFERLARDNPRLRLTFVGPDNGIVAETGETLRFEAFMQQNFPAWVRERIDYRGRLDHGDVMSIRKRHYLTLIAARFDTFGYMLLESMSVGCPLVTTAVGGIPEVIADRKNGLLVPPQDEDAMVAACRSLLEDATLAARLGWQARADCRERYGSEIVARQMVELYQCAIGRFEQRKRTARPE